MTEAIGRILPEWQAHQDVQQLRVYGPYPLPTITPNMSSPLLLPPTATAQCICWFKTDRRTDSSSHTSSDVSYLAAPSLHAASFTAFWLILHQGSTGDTTSLGPPHTSRHPCVSLHPSRSPFLNWRSIPVLHPHSDLYRIITPSNDIPLPFPAFAIPVHPKL